MLKTSSIAIGSALAGCMWGTPSSEERSTTTVTVGPGNIPKFEPETARVSSEATVEWVWESSNHNVVVSMRPAGATWEGTPGDETITYGPGYTYEKTFSVAGDYDYFCQPHVDAGMVGTVRVE